MKRRDFVVIIAMLGLGIVSTLALDIFATDLMEPLAIETTLTYKESSAVFSNPVTTINDDNIIHVTFDIFQASEKQIELTVKPCDQDGKAIISDGTPGTYTYSVKFLADGATTYQIPVPNPRGVTAGEPLTFTIITDPEKGVITGLSVMFANDGILAEYESMILTVIDN